MANWKRQIKGVSPLLKAHDVGELPFEGMRDQVVAILQEDPAFEADDQTEFTDTVYMLSGADDIGEFDEWMDTLYDWADGELVWISPTE